MCSNLELATNLSKKCLKLNIYRHNTTNRIFQYELFQGINARSHYCSVMFGSHNDFESTNKRKR